MFMGGEIYLPGYEKPWRIGRELNLPIALHVVGTFGMQPTFEMRSRRPAHSVRTVSSST